MKTISYLAVILTAIHRVLSHYTFNSLVVNGVATRDWQYVRQNTRVEKYMPTKFKNSPSATTPESFDFRCNEGSFTTAGQTDTLTVDPGTPLGLKIGYGATMRHPGPAQVYLSRAPGSVRDYDGAGDWFKIHQELVCGSTADGLQDTDWCTWDRDTIAFAIPPATPPGEYLVRAEHIALHGAHVGEAEFYYSCAQINVTGDGRGIPGPTVKIPGVYKRDDAAVNFSIYGARKYPYVPGPAVWDGAEGSDAAPTRSKAADPIPSSSSVLPSSLSSISASASITSLASDATTAPSTAPACEVQYTTVYDL